MREGKRYYGTKLAIFGGSQSEGRERRVSAPTVVVADSEVNLCRVLVARVQQMGIRCLVAHDVESLLRTLHTTPIAVAVVDWLLPPYGGIAAIQVIQREMPTVGCILTTTTDAVQLSSEATAPGVKAVIQKPFDLEAFADLIWREVYHVPMSGGGQPLLQNGERVVVGIRGSGGEYTYALRIVSQDDHILQLEPPVDERMDWANLAKGVAFVQFTREDGVYQFRTRLSVRKEPQLSLWIHKPSSIRRIQRRRHTRIRQTGQVFLALRGEEGNAPVTVVGELYDVSMGGFSALLTQVPPLGKELSFQITVGSGDKDVTGQAVAVRAGSVLTERVPARYRVGFRFTHVTVPGRRVLLELIHQAAHRE